jgi:hypothetical protein
LAKRVQRRELIFEVALAGHAGSVA